MRKCPICLKPFVPMYNSTQKTCNEIKCAIEKARQDREKKEKLASRKETRRRKQALKSKSDWLKEAEAACNAYIRWRDRNEPCISCGTMSPDIQYCAGHYKTKGGYPELRFHPFNINRQCNQYCNLQLSGNISNYRPKLIEKIGISQVEWLEGKHKPQNLTIDDIQDIKQYYKDRLKAERDGVIKY